MSKRIYVLCEGQTEERFITDVLAPIFYPQDIYLSPVVITTKRTVNKKYKGGISHYAQVKKELIALCRQHKNEFVTTMIDYYMLPQDTPGYSCDEGDLYRKVEHIEGEIVKDILDSVNINNLFCYLSVHEYEALLFSCVNSFEIITTKENCDKLEAMKRQFISPEHINSSFETAPSKRIIDTIPSYSKTMDGTLLAQEIGVDLMKKQCRHFREWLLKIEEIT